MSYSLKYIATFKVRVRLGCFPLDMLRYDRCTPSTQEDVSKIQHSQLETYTGGPIEVELMQYTETRAPRITEERWKSFGCDVLKDTVEVRKMI